MKTRALVTGASRGIGAAIAEALAGMGHPVILNYRQNHVAARSVQARIEAAGGEARLSAFDVADAAESARALEELLSADPRPIGVVINNAGITRDAAFPALQRGEWDEVTRTTLDGFFNVTQPLVMQMVHNLSLIHI